MFEFYLVDLKIPVVGNWFQKPALRHRLHPAYSLLSPPQDLLHLAPHYAYNHQKSTNQ